MHVPKRYYYYYYAVANAIQPEERGPADWHWAHWKEMRVEVVAKLELRD